MTRMKYWHDFYSDGQITDHSSFGKKININYTHYYTVDPKAGLCTKISQATADFGKDCCATTTPVLK